jgi:hypothetical protein
LDDLRDYRFYEADLIHPNKVAINYIWDFFKQSFLSKTTIKLIAEIEKITNSSKHRPFNPKSVQHQAFLKQQLEAITSLSEKLPFLDFSNEKMIFEHQLS